MRIDCGGEKYAVLHDGDFSGDFEIIMDAGRATRAEGGSRVGVTVPFAVLTRVVAEVVRQEKIGRLLQAADADLLGLSR